MPDPEAVRQVFSRIAPRYDLLNTLLSLGLHKVWRRRAVALCGEGEWALDVCAGTGDLSRRLARRFRRVVGVDFCRPMLRVAQCASDAAAWVEGDALALPFGDDHFDCAIIAFSLRNVADLGRLFGEMARVVKPGCPVVSLELTRPTGRTLGWAHRCYLRSVVPAIGSLVDRAAYRHLAKTVSNFPAPEEVAEVMGAAGLCQVAVHRLCCGIATIHTGAAPGRYDTRH